MGFDKISRLYHTLKPLRFTQVYYQIKYRFVRPKRVQTLWGGTFAKPNLVEFPEKQESLLVNKDVWRFDFLNLERCFSKYRVDWSFRDFGMLWTYNLNYFDWLHQPDMSKELGLETLSQFYATPLEKNPIILHPYPTSLRIINIAKFISKWGVKVDWLYYELLSDLRFLSGRLEYHLLANHLLENAFALYIGGLITNQKEFTEKGKKLLVHELKEQVLNDGMHYERTPMYHLIILERLLDALNFAEDIGDDLKSVLKSYAIKMTGLAMNWQDLERIPMMQDSAYDIALPVPSILDYSKSLLGEDYPFKSNDLDDSGYRILNSGDLSLIANVGSISPSYQPGHAHADELNFELFHKGIPIIVDSGVSTYEKNQRRQQERSTTSHNCISIDGNSSDVWSGFRVGRRAAVTISSDEKHVIKAQHDGYRTSLSREFQGYTEGHIVIKDQILYKSSSSCYCLRGLLHLHPEVKLEQIDERTILLNRWLKCTFQTDKNNSPSLILGDYEYANGYNKLIPSKVISYSVFEETIIQVSEAN